MKPVNEMDLKFLSRSSNESFARAAVAAFVAQIDPTIDELADIKTAVSEAVTNCIVHAYREDLGMIYINVKLFENGTIAIRVRDKGCGIENVKKAMEPMFTTAGGERAGLGFAVMESFMNRLKVSSKVGKGTTVAMEKVIIRRGLAKWITGSRRLKATWGWCTPARSGFGAEELNTTIWFRRAAWDW